MDHELSIQQHLIALNKALIDGYYNQCQGKWFLYPYHDYYYYQYLIYHSIEADDYSIIQLIMSDFKWMDVKISIDNTIYNLCADIKKAYEYLEAKGIEVIDID